MAAARRVRGEDCLAPDNDRSVQPHTTPPQEPSMPKKKTAAKKMTKTAWVKSQPATLTAKEVVEKAKSQGIQLTDKYVWVIRSSAKSKGTTGKSTKSSSTSVEDLLRAAASEIGLSRAIAILQAQQASLRAVLGR
jgi:hypothetical protein